MKLKDKIDRAKQIQDEIIRLEQEIKAYEKQLKKLPELRKNEESQVLYLIVELDEPNYSLLSRKIFHKKKYETELKKYQENQKQIQDNEKIKKEIKDRYDRLEKELQEKIESNKKKLENLYNDNKEVCTIIKASLIKEKNGFIFIDDELPDYFEKLVNQDFEKKISLDDLIMVHATKYFPDDLLIRTSSYNHVVYTNHNVNGESFSRRNTIHTAINGMVGDHAEGEWKNCPIIILDPMKYHIDQIACLCPVDTYTYGSMKLSKDSIILIKEEEFDKLYKQHKVEFDKIKDKIIIFKGNPSKITKKLLILLGYKPQSIYDWCWPNEKNENLFESFAAEYPDKEKKHHVNTAHGITEKELAERDTILNKRRGKIEDYRHGGIITLDELVDLWTYYEKNYIAYKGIENYDIYYEDFIRRFGIRFNDNKIVLLGYKEILQRYKEKISQKQIEKFKLLLKKYKIEQNPKYKSGEEFYRRWLRKRYPSAEELAKELAYLEQIEQFTKFMEEEKEKGSIFK